MFLAEKGETLCFPAYLSPACIAFSIGTGVSGLVVLFGQRFSRCAFVLILPIHGAFQCSHRSYECKWHVVLDCICTLH